MRKNISTFCKASAFCLFMITAACAKTGADPGKVYDPGEISTNCAENLGLDGAVIMSLAAAFRDSNGYITDEFRAKASGYIAESENTQPSPNDPLFRQYISCLEGSVAQESSLLRLLGT